jgi:hypothetical protein
MRFDTYCARVPIGKVDLIKVDVEGAELRVLKGMGELLQIWKPHIVCEVLEGYSVSLISFLPTRLIENSSSPWTDYTRRMSFAPIRNIGTII